MNRHYQGCINCGAPLPKAGSRYCMFCGAPQQRKSAVGSFVLAILKCLAFWLVMESVTGIVIAVYQKLVAGSMPTLSAISEEVYTGSYWQLFSKYSAYVLMGADVLVIVLLVAFYKILGKKVKNECAVHRMPPVSFGAVLLIGASAQVAVTTLLTLAYTLFPSLQTLSPDLDSYYQQMFGGGSLAAEIVYVALVTPLLEEFIFRGLMYTRLRAAMPKWAAVILSAVFFAAAHGNIEQFSYTLILGIILAAAFERYNSIWASFAIHAGFNGASYLVEYLRIDSEGELITAMLTSLGVMLLCIAFIFFTRPVYKTISKGAAHII